MQGGPLPCYTKHPHRVPFYSGPECGLLSEAQVNSAEIYYLLQGLHTTLEDGETEAPSVCLCVGGVASPWIVLTPQWRLGIWDRGVSE